MTPETTEKLGPFEVNTVVVGNCLEITKQLPNESIDLIVADPPYILTKDFDQDNLHILWEEFARTLKQNCTVYWFGQAPWFYEVWPIASQFFNFQAEIVWAKPRPPGVSSRTFSRGHENILVVSKGKDWLYNLEGIKENTTRYLLEGVLAGRIKLSTFQRHLHDGPRIRGGRRWDSNDIRTYDDSKRTPDDVWYFHSPHGHTTAFSDPRYNHEHQKPLRLMERIVKASSNVDDLIFDPFVGSGTVPFVSNKLDRRFFACDIDPKCVRDTLMRLEGIL